MANEIDDLMSGVNKRYAEWLLSMTTIVGDCMECHLSNVSQGYCKLKENKLAHRFVYTALVCDPGDLLVLHKCDNRRCINPEHLFHGTHYDNVLDMMAKGRHDKSTGPGFGTKKLISNEEHIEMIKLYSEGWSHRNLADKYFCSKKTIFNYLQREPTHG